MVILVDQLRSGILGTLTTKRDKGFSFPRGHIQRKVENSEKLRVSTDMTSDIVQEIGGGCRGNQQSKIVHKRDVRARDCNGVIQDREWRSTGGSGHLV